MTTRRTPEEAIDILSSTHADLCAMVWDGDREEAKATYAQLLLDLIAHTNPSEGPQALPVCLKDALDAFAAERERAEAAERAFKDRDNDLALMRAERDSLAAQLAEAKVVRDQLWPYNRSPQCPQEQHDFDIASDIDAALKGSK